MNRIVIGTAGHVDHGKTALTRALTGIDTDRLPAEKQRGITIELGFAPLTLTDRLKADIIDVPGHEKFIKTMVAGIAGVDLVLFTIAADEGIMPQTVEHLDIINLLCHRHGVIAITKADKSEPAALAALTEQLRELFADSSLIDPPIIPVSAYTGSGLAELKQAIIELAEHLPPRKQLDTTRLPIDRCFSVKGFGTVATGTLWSGRLAVGDRVDLLPIGKRCKIRRLEVNGEAVESCGGSSRLAINLNDITSEELRPGSWLTKDLSLQAARRLDVLLTLLPSAAELKHNARLRLRFGTGEVLGRVRFSERESLAPGEDCLAQIDLETPIYPLPHDILILGSYSPVSTIGSAKVIAINPPKSKRHASGAQVKETTPNDPQQQAVQLLREYHRTYPLRPGMPLAEFKHKALRELPPSEQREQLAVWQQRGVISVLDNLVSVAHFNPIIDQATLSWEAETLEELRRAEFRPPPWSELVAPLPHSLQKEVLPWLLYEGRVVKLDEDIVVRKATYMKARKLITDHLLANGEITLAEARSLLGTGRKFALAFLEALDRDRVTKRLEDKRVLCKPKA